MITILTVKNINWLTEISLLYTVNNCDRSDGIFNEILPQKENVKVFGSEKVIV